MCCALVTDLYRVLDLASLPADELAYQELRRFWPASNIDAVVKIQGGEYNRALIPSITGKLVASSFYLELEGDRMSPATKSPRVLYAAVRCRLPPGPATVDLMVKLCLRKSQFLCSGDNNATVSSYAICPPSVWEEVRGGRQFLQLLRIQMGSLGSTVDVRISGLCEESISNCPCDPSLLQGYTAGVTAESQAQKTSMSLDLLQRKLANI